MPKMRLTNKKYAYMSRYKLNAKNASALEKHTMKMYLMDDSFFREQICKRLNVHFPRDISKIISLMLNEVYETWFRSVVKEIRDLRIWVNEMSIQSSLRSVSEVIKEMNKYNKDYLNGYYDMPISVMQIDTDYNNSGSIINLRNRGLSHIFGYVAIIKQERERNARLMIEAK